MSSDDPFATPRGDVPDPAAERPRAADPWFRADSPSPPGRAVPPDALPADDVPPPLPPWAEPDDDRPRRPRPPHPGFWWALLWCVVALVVTQVFGGIAGGIVGAIILVGRAVAYGEDPNQLLQPGGQAEATRFILAYSLPFIALFGGVLALLLLRLWLGRDWARKVALRWPAGVHVLLVLVGLPALSVLGGGVQELVKALGVPGFHNLGVDVESSIRALAQLPVTYLVLMIAVGPAVWEELFCRAFLGHGLVGRYGVLGGVLLTSFFFGLIHIDPPQAIAAAALGLGLHLAYLATRSLWVPMLLHFVNNGLAVLALTQAVPELETVNAPPEHAPALLYLAAAALLAAVGWALYQSRARLVPAPGEPGPAWRPAYPGVECPPADSGTVVRVPWPGWLPALAVVVALGVFAAAGYWSW